MTNINATNLAPKKRGVGLMKKNQTRIDMTPMVDLGFLLITFFVMTARLSEPATLPLIMPKDGPPIDIAQSSALSVLVNGNDVFYYNGDWETAVKEHAVSRTSLDGKTGLRQVILAKQDFLEKSKQNKLGKDGLMLLMKAGPDTEYNTLVGLMDETLISHVTRHAFVKITQEELSFIRHHER